MHNPTIQKIYYTIALLFAVSAFAGCQKGLGVLNEDKKYASLQDVYAKNGVPVQNFSIPLEAVTIFTTVAGTKVTVPASAFEDADGNTITGTANIEFREIYKKSDMLLSGMPTMYKGRPLKSGGEFFIRAKQGDKPLQLKANKKITIEQPFAATGVADPAMAPFVGNNDSAAVNWQPALLDSARIDTLGFTVSGYVFSLYQFAYPLANGTWCNSDNSSYFDGYTQTMLTVSTTDTGFSTIDVFLVFTDINCMVHVYSGGPGMYPYPYAPLGLKCTVVAAGVKGGNLYSSFTPTTISDNQTVPFSLLLTTLEDFEAQLEGLNH